MRVEAAELVAIAVVQWKDGVRVRVVERKDVEGDRTNVRIVNWTISSIRGLFCS